MQDRIALITGATDGIGKVTAREIAKKGYHTVIVGRNPTKTAAVLAELRQQVPGASLDSLLADLSSIEQTQALVTEFRQRYSHLEVLVNNVGSIFMQRQLSADGYEMTFALNHLVGYFLLTDLLLETLVNSAPARIVNVASNAHFYGTLNFDDLQHQRHYNLLNFYQVYCDSKLMNVLFTFELARRLAGAGVTVNALHPGLVGTNFVRANNRGILGRLGNTAVRAIAISEAEGAATSIHLATAPQVAHISGEYFVGKQVARAAKAAYDADDAARLWEVSRGLLDMRTHQPA